MHLTESSDEAQLLRKKVEELQSHSRATDHEAQEQNQLLSRQLEALNSQTS